MSDQPVTERDELSIKKYTKTPTDRQNEQLLKSIYECLSGVLDPELHLNIVELGMLGNIDITEEEVRIEVALTITGCPLKEQIRRDVIASLEDLVAPRQIMVVTKVLGKEEKARLMEKVRSAAQQRITTSLSRKTKIFAVASGKGGVGKSSVSVNLALSLSSLGKKVALLDADIWGFSIPELLGIHNELAVKNKKIEPVRIKNRNSYLEVISMGFLANSQEAIMWRGLVLSRALQHFLEDVNWSADLDYLIIDLPPGTGDIQMALARMLPETELLLVTTPSNYVEQIASRAADMARKSHIRIFGVIENMSYFTCDHLSSYTIFGYGGGERLAKFLHVPLLASIPIDPHINQLFTDTEKPPQEEAWHTAEVFTELSSKIIELTIDQEEMLGCSARMLDNVERSLNNL